MSYEMLKHPHLLLIAITAGLFAIRLVGGLIGLSIVHAALVRILHHLSDLGVLVTGLLLGHFISQYPFANDWLTAKFAALLVYMVLAPISLKRGSIVGLILAGGALGYAAWVGLNKVPFPAVF